MPFQPGQSGNKAGRPKGSKNRQTLEAEAFARGIVESSAYRASLEARVEAGSLPPGVETMLWHYAYGKPKESLEVSGDADAPLRVIFGGRYRPEPVEGE